MHGPQECVARKGEGEANTNVIMSFYTLYMLWELTYGRINWLFSPHCTSAWLVLCCVVITSLLFINLEECDHNLLEFTKEKININFKITILTTKRKGKANEFKMRNVTVLRRNFTLP